MTNRKINLGKLINTRDLHGLKNKDGFTIKKDRLYRSDALCRISSDDMLYLKNEKNLKTIIDFRGKDELTSSSLDPLVSGINHYYLPVNEGIRNRGTRPHSVHSTNKDLDGMIDFFYYLDEKGDVTNSSEKLYREFVTHKIALENLSKFLNYVHDNDGLLIYHCSDGKDRTGIATMLILTILNYDLDTIFEDYLLTNENIIEKAKKRRKMLIDTGVDDEIILHSSDVMAGVLKNWLEAAIDEIDKRYGSRINFITEGLHFSKEKQENMRNNYLIKEEN